LSFGASNRTHGSQPSSPRICVVFAFVRRWSPGTSGSVITVSGYEACRSIAALRMPSATDADGRNRGRGHEITESEQEP
jgi:hypothetical protein